MSVVFFPQVADPRHSKGGSCATTAAVSGSARRLEQRFVDGDGQAGWRFREFVKASYAFPSASRFGLAAYDEVFFDLNDTS
jgi:hypothetical protein